MYFAISGNRGAPKFVLYHLGEKWGAESCTLPFGEKKAPARARQNSRHDQVQNRCRHFLNFLTWSPRHTVLGARQREPAARSRGRAGGRPGDRLVGWSGGCGNIGHSEVGPFPVTNQSQINHKSSHKSSHKSILTYIRVFAFFQIKQFERI